MAKESILLYCLWFSLLLDFLPHLAYKIAHLAFDISPFPLSPFRFLLMALSLLGMFHVFHQKQY